MTYKYTAGTNVKGEEGDSIRYQPFRKRMNRLAALATGVMILGYAWSGTPDESPLELNADKGIVIQDGYTHADSLKMKDFK